MDKKKKLILMRVLKVFFYLLGFPLLFFFVVKDSMVYFNEDVFSETATKGIWFVFGIWAAFTLIQIGLSFTVKKTQTRTIITVIVALALLMIPMQIFDASTTKKLDNIRTENEKYGAQVNTFNKQAQWYNTLSDKEGYSEILITNVDRFIRVYGLDGYYPKNYRTITQVNTLAVDSNGNLCNDDKVLDKIIAESGYIYNPNGLLYDGYIFGVENALDLLIQYHEFQAKKFTDESDKRITADQALAAAIARAEASEEWIAYSTSETYLANQEEAAKMYITEERLSAILDALLKGLGSNEDLAPLLSIISGALPEYSNLFDLFKAEGPEATVDVVCDAAYGILNTLTHKQDALRENLSATSPAEDWAEYDAAVLESQKIIDTLAKIGITDISSAAGLKKGLMGFLGEISYYQHPENKMSWDFMTAEDKALGLDKYAWVKYHCEKFGRVSGCVLIPTDAPLVGGTIGNGTDAKQAFTKAELYQLRTDLSYQSEVYPLLSARRYINIWYGIIALSIFLTSTFAKKEKDILKELTAGGIA